MDFNLFIGCNNNDNNIIKKVYTHGWKSIATR